MNESTEQKAKRLVDEVLRDTFAQWDLDFGFFFKVEVYGKGEAEVTVKVIHAGYEVGTLAFRVFGGRVELNWYEDIYEPATPENIWARAWFNLRERVEK